MGPQGLWPLWRRSVGCSDQLPRFACLPFPWSLPCICFNWKRQQPCWLRRCPPRRHSLIGRGKTAQVPSHETGDGRSTVRASVVRPTDHNDRPMSVFFPDRPTTNNGREREREGRKEGGGGKRQDARGKGERCGGTGRRRTNREATLNARFVAGRPRDGPTERPT